MQRNDDTFFIQDDIWHDDEIHLSTPNKFGRASNWRRTKCESHSLTTIILIIFVCLYNNVLLYLNTPGGFLGLRHPHRLGGGLLREQLSAAQVVSSKDHPADQVVWVARPWDCVTEEEGEMKTLKWEVAKKTYYFGGQPSVVRSLHRPV